VPSQALKTWRSTSSDRLDELLAAHASVGGTSRGRRYATEQLNASFLIQIAAHFQLFCRDLHSEAAQILVAAAPPAYAPMLRVAFTNRRGLDRGNASVDVIAADFARFDFDIWTAARAASGSTATRQMRLDQLNTWRNAIAHQDFVFSAQQQALLSGTSVTLRWARAWRSSCNGLAQTFDRVVGDYLAAIARHRPW